VASVSGRAERVGADGGRAAPGADKAEHSPDASRVTTRASGPFEMMTPRGFLAGEGAARSLAIMTRVATWPAKVRKMAWLMPRMAKAVPYLGYILVTGRKPR
jgi:hypothetical protein